MIKDYIYLLPETFLVFSIIILLLFGTFYTTSKNHNYLDLTSNVGYLSCYCLFISFLLSLNNSLDSISLLNDVLLYTPFISFLKSFILFFSIIFVFISISYLKYEKIQTFEFYIIFLFSVLGMLLLLSSFDFLSLYLALELQSLSFYLLAAYKQKNIFSSEASLKYFILGVYSSIIYLLGVSIIYGYMGTINFEDLLKLFSGTNMSNFYYYKTVQIGILFIYISFLFKLSIVPFHLWVPDIYEGIPIPIALLFSTLPKLSLLGIFIFLYYAIFNNFLSEWIDIMLFLSMFSIIIGTLGAFFQKKIKRFLAYSSISHMGFIFLSLSLGTFQSLMSVIFYLIIYIVTIFNLWTILLSLKYKNKDGYAIYFTDLNNLFKINPLLTHCLTISLFSLSGIPPLAGFFGKYYIFLTLINNNYYYYAFLAILMSVISAFYYVKIIKIIYFENNKLKKQYEKINFTNSFFIIVFTTFILFFFFLFNFYIAYMSKIILFL